MKKVPALLIISLCFVLLQTGQAQEIKSDEDSSFLSKKTVFGSRITTPPKIDGILDDPVWDVLPAATHFVQHTPYNGEPPVYETFVQFGYNDVALYVGIFMYDSHPDSIPRELGRRDQIDDLNTDFVSIDILPYNDGLNMYEFKISACGIQGDGKYSAVGQDRNWDAVWESAVHISDSGWSAEVKIPYSALRFPKREEQVWGINIWRNLQRYREYSTWTYIPNDVEEILRYYGELRGIEEIKPPVRLSMTPYLGAYIENHPGSKKWTPFIRGGMDLRYGINQSFTLDMELIPDFGQVQSDDIILNLSPFEVRYNEKRQFFTEGTELFEKCDIFYSRRVGGEPKGYEWVEESLRPDEVITKNPDRTQLINATKISGRNSRGLGLGFFNGMTTNTLATVEDTLTGTTRRISTQPVTNYNVLVVDQNLPNNSYVTFINTNYWIPEWRYCANVTGGETKLTNKRNTLTFLGRLNVSQLFLEHYHPDFGYQSTIAFSRPSGTIRYELENQITDNRYNPNDMGFLEKNNEIRNFGVLSYNIYDPTWKFLRARTEFQIKYYTRYQPFNFMFMDVELNQQALFKNYLEVYGEIAWRPFGYYDYYEPRVNGWFYRRPPSWDGGIELETDSRKWFSVGLESGFFAYSEDHTFSYWVDISPRFRFSDRFSAYISINYSNVINGYGWVETQWDSLNNPTIFFGRRDVTTLNNILNIRYIFNTGMSVNLRIRHYWSKANYLSYYTLNRDGNLIPAAYPENANVNFNAFSLDLQFLWYFAPGSELSLVWKNNILNQGNIPAPNYIDALQETFSSPSANSISIRVLYHLDYIYLKSWFRKKKDSMI
ncbi:MAG: carbohydrate binding family 9 domain-containing protein [Bacteroidales bacterium]|nr:carbohydrate binding family 9 domain-containing protein [Bacteroidota bacterium]MBL6950658.1 carbohydrate binding family 9 domain-containing protein [Bacteroidales bacterium]